MDLVACAGSDQAGIQVWSTLENRLITTLSTNRAELGSIVQLSFSPNGGTLAALYHHPTDIEAGSTGLLLWNADTFTEIASLQPVPTSRTLAFSPDGRYLAAGVENSVVFWDVQSLSQVKTIEGHDAFVIALAFSADGSTLLSGSADLTVRSWAVGAPTSNVGVGHGHRTPVLDVAWGPDGRSASSDQDRLTFLWNAELDRPLGPLPRSVVLAYPNQDAVIAQRGDQIIRWNLKADDWRRLACDVANRNLTEEEWQRYLPAEEYQETCP